MEKQPLNLQARFARMNETLDAAGSQMPLKQRQMAMEIATRASLLANGYKADEINMTMDRLLEGASVDVPSAEIALQDFEREAAKRPNALYKPVLDQALRQGALKDGLVGQEQAFVDQANIVVQAHNNRERAEGFAPRIRDEVEHVGEVTLDPQSMDVLAEAARQTPER